MGALLGAPQGGRPSLCTLGDATWHHAFLSPRHNPHPEIMVASVTAGLRWPPEMLAVM